MATTKTGRKKIGKSAQKVKSTGPATCLAATSASDPTAWFPAVTVKKPKNKPGRKAKQ